MGFVIQAKKPKDTSFGFLGRRFSVVFVPRLGFGDGLRRLPLHRHPGGVGTLPGRLHDAEQMLCRNVILAVFRKRREILLLFKNAARRHLVKAGRIQLLEELEMLKERGRETLALKAGTVDPVILARSLLSCRVRRA